MTEFYLPLQRFGGAEMLNDLGTADDCGLGNTLVGTYLTTLGLPEFAASARPNQMNWLTADHALKLGIMVIVVS